MVLNIIIIFMTLSQSKAVKLELFELPEHSYPHPQPYCNDGTQAVYYHDTDFSKLGKIHVHLNGGSLCDSDEACIQRCDKDGDGIVDNRLCTASTRPIFDIHTGWFSNSSENPLHDFWHVDVPYCSSDFWAGTGRSAGTGYYFHGKHIFRDVMNSLSHHFNLFQATEFVLSGSSAGAFGVGYNCDDVADWLRGNNPAMKIMCLADSPDFIPWWVHTEDCKSRQENYETDVEMFWGREPDTTCKVYMENHQTEFSAEERTCGIMSQYLSHVTTPIFVAVSLQDPVISHGKGCPEPGSEEEILLPWMVGMVDLITNVTQTRPEVGWWSPNCPLHVLAGHNQVMVEDREDPDGQRLSLYSALSRWMSGELVHAVDSLDDENPTCANI